MIPLLNQKAMKLFLWIVILLCLGISLLAWMNLNKTGLVTPETKSKNISGHLILDPLVSSNTPSSSWKSLTDPSIRWQVRVDLLRRLDKETLSETDVDALYSLLEHRPLSGQAENWWVVVNEIMEQMRLQAIGRDRYSKTLLVIIRDPFAPEVLRDYTIQHLGQWISPRGEDIGVPHEEDPVLVRKAVVAISNTVRDASLAHSSIPGTALNVLIDVREGGIEPKIIKKAMDELEPWFSKVIPDRISISSINRAEAISAVACLGRRKYSPIIRELAFSKEGDPTLRLRSIAALGYLGEESDMESLRGIVLSGSPLRHAAQNALIQLSATINEPSFFIEQ